ncbi:Hydrogenase accessory protein HypB, partial [human gut metagenome]
TNHWWPRTTSDLHGYRLIERLGMQVQVKTNVLAKNDAIAESLQQLFKEKNIFVFNLLGSPGAGKTSL